MSKENTTEKATFSFSDFFGFKQIATFASLVVSLAVIIDYVTVVNLFQFSTGVFVMTHPVLKNPVSIVLLTLLPALTIIFSIFLTMFAFIEYKWINKFYDPKRLWMAVVWIVSILTIHLFGFILLSNIDNLTSFKEILSFIKANIVVMFLICYLYTIILFGLLRVIIQQSKSYQSLLIFTGVSYISVIVGYGHFYNNVVAFIIAFFSIFGTGLFVYYKYVVLPILEKKSDIKKYFDLTAYGMVLGSIIMLGFTYINFNIWKDELKPDWSIGIINKNFMIENKYECKLIGPDYNVTTSKFNKQHRSYFLRVPMAENVYWFFENDINSSVIKVSVAEKQSDNTFQLIDTKKYEKNTH